jgi:hypothetical protein
MPQAIGGRQRIARRALRSPSVAATVTGPTPAGHGSDEGCHLLDAFEVNVAVQLAFLASACSSAMIAAPGFTVSAVMR